MSLRSTLSFIAQHPLSRGRRARNIAGFLKWQIGARLVPGPVVVDLIDGARLFARPGMTGATGNVYVGLQDFSEMALLIHLLRPGDLFVDVGANVGSYTILAGVGAGARCVAFEPDPKAIGWLRSNIGLNRLDGLVQARQIAIGSHAGKVEFSTGRDTVNHVLPAGEIVAGRSGQTVDMTTLDAALDGACPTMLKIDVEGYEAEVIKGAAATLAAPKLHCIVMEQIGSGERYGFDEEALRATLSALKFETFTYLPRGRQLVPCEARNGKNAVFLRDLPFVRDRLERAAPFQVRGMSI